MWSTAILSLLSSKPHYFIFQTSLREGVFPDEMKILKFSPKFKGGNSLQTENYRPILALTVFCVYLSL